MYIYTYSSDSIVPDVWTGTKPFGRAGKRPRAAAVEEEILHKATVEFSYLVLVRGGVCFSLVEILGLGRGGVCFSLVEILGAKSLLYFSLRRRML